MSAEQLLWAINGLRGRWWIKAEIPAGGEGLRIGVEMPLLLHLSLQRDYRAFSGRIPLETKTLFMSPAFQDSYGFAKNVRKGFLAFSIRADNRSAYSDAQKNPGG